MTNVFFERNFNNQAKLIVIKKLIQNIGNFK